MWKSASSSPTPWRGRGFGLRGLVACAWLIPALTLGALGNAFAVAAPPGLGVVTSVVDQDALFDAQAGIASPDGADIYVISQDALAHLRRDAATGQPELAETYRDGAGGVSGLFGGQSLAMAPDGTSVYAGTARGLLVFSRNPGTGALSLVEMHSADGGLPAIAVSPDGSHVYLAEYEWDDIAVMARNPTTGALTLLEIEQDGQGGVTGLRGPRGLAVSPNGAHLYVASEWSDALAIFQRAPGTGLLTFVSALQDGQPGTAGLTEPRGITLSANGAFAYVTSPWSDTLTAWSRNPGSGALTLVETWAKGDPGMAGLDGVRTLAITPDGLGAFATDNDTLVRFDRNAAAGTLGYGETYRDGKGGFGGLGGEGNALPIAAQVYRTSAGDDALTLLGPLDPAGGSIGGQIVAADAGPLPGIRAQAFAWNGGLGDWAPVRAAWTDAGGDYSLPGLPAGTYRICFTDENTGRYLPECHLDAAELATATDVALAAGQAIADIDAELAALPLSGTVTGADGSPLPGVRVEVKRWIQYPWGDYWAVIAHGVTDAAGRFSFAGLPAGFGQLCFSHPDYAPVCREGQSYGDYDIQLITPAGHVIGRVTDLNNAPISGVAVTAWQRHHSAGTWWFEQLAWDTTDTNGDYHLGGLDSGTYEVCFDADAYVRECFDDAQDQWGSAQLPVTAGETLAEIDAQLAPAGYITGTVTDDAQAPLSGIHVEAQVWNGSWWDYRDQVTTDGLGGYRLKLPTGTYRVCFYDWGNGNYLSECYDNAPDQNAAADIPVTAGDTTSGIDAALARAGSLSGRVTDGQGNGIGNVWVVAGHWVDNVHGGGWFQWGPQQPTAPDGTYRIGGLTAGTYQVCFQTWNIPAYAGECWDDKPLNTQADPVTVVGGEDTPAIDAVLAAPGSISGRVTDAAGAGVQGVQVQVGHWITSGPGNGYLNWQFSAWTNATGSYQIGGLTAGSYQVCFSSTGSLLGECWNDRPLNSPGDSVVVQSGLDTPGIDASLYQPAADGYEPDDSPEAASTIAPGETQARNLYNPSGTDVDWASFTLPQLSAVRIQTSGPSGPWLELYRGSDWLEYQWSNWDGQTYKATIQRACNGTPLDTGDYLIRTGGSYWGWGDPRYTLSLLSAPCSAEVDTDGDGHDNMVDNCVFDANADQLDFDTDGQGNVCDTDDDGDGAPDVQDAFPLDPSEQNNDDNDGLGNNADPDDNGDGIPDDAYEPDNSPAAASTLQPGVPQEHTLVGNFDQDWVKFTLAAESAVVLTATPLTVGQYWFQVYDEGMQSFGVWYPDEAPITILGTACGVDPLPPGTYYVQASRSSAGAESPAYTLSLAVEPCVLDSDIDGVSDVVDNCPHNWNPGQNNFDGDGLGNACDDDIDGDGLSNAVDPDPYHDGVPPPVLLVDDDNNTPDVRGYYTEVLDAQGVAYDVWDTGNADDEPAADLLASYRAVVWFTGEAWDDAAGPGPDGEAALGTYLDGGGCLALSAQDYHFDRGLTAFMADYLGAASVSDDEGQTDVTGVGPFAGLGPFTLSYPFDDYSDVLTPDTLGAGVAAEVIFSGDSGDAAIAKIGDAYTTLFFGFPLEALDLPDRTETLDAALNLCGLNAPASIGVWRSSVRRFYLDADGSHKWDGGDVVSSSFGLSTDTPLIGDWNGDGKDEIGVYRSSNRRFLLDMDGSDSWTAGDVTSAAFGVAGDLPLAGDWNGDGTDEIGIYRPSNRRFYLDMDGSRSWTASDVTSAPFGIAGDVPLAGDWNGDGTDDIGIYRPSSRRFLLDMDGSDSWTAGDLTSAAFGIAGDLPLANDWNGDGIDEIGIYRPSNRRFYLDMDGSDSWTAGDVTSAAFGIAGDLPISGRW